jgi:hypothetical protein
MRKRSGFRISPVEELDMQHQGSVGGQELFGIYGKFVNQEVNISSFSQSGKEGFAPGREPAEGADVAMSSPSHERWEQKTPERAPSEGPEQGPEQEPSKKHHYK